MVFVLWVERRLRVFENRVLRGIFVVKRDGVTGECRKLHDLFCLPNIVRVIKSRRMRWTGNGGNWSCILVFDGVTWGKRPLGRHMYRWEDNIKMDFQEVGCGGMDWIELAHDRESVE
jgi:hypothetical protein